MADDAAPPATDPVIYYLCLEYVGTGKQDAMRVHIGVNQPRADSRRDHKDERWLLGRAAVLAIFSRPGAPPPGSTWLNRIATAVLLNASPAGDPASKNSRERHVAGMRADIMRRWPSMIALPAPTGLDHPVAEDKATWDECRERAEAWCKAHAREMERIFYDWASAHPQIDTKTDFSSLVDDLCSLWRRTAR